MKKYFFCILIGMSIMGLAWGGYEFYKYKTSEIEIGRTEEGKQGIKEKPDDKQNENWKYWRAYAESQLRMTAKPRGMWLDMRCEDDFKFKEMSYEIKCPVLHTWSIWVGISAGFYYQRDLANITNMKNLDFIYGAELGFIRHFGRFGVGAAAFYQQGISSKYYSGGLKAIMLFDI